MKEEIVLKKIGSLIRKKEQTVSVAESVTAGKLQQSLASIEKASEFFQGGMTVFNLGQKSRHLNVEPIEAQKNNCVSANVAQQMATEVAIRFQSDWGLAVTGYATPIPESGNKVFAFFAISFQGKIRKTKKIIPSSTDPKRIPSEYVTTILEHWNVLLSARNR